MLSLIALLIFAGFYCLYASSARKVAPNALGVENRLLQHRYYGRFAGSGFLLISLGLAIYLEGMGAGIFIWSILIMTCGSLVVVLTPLGLIRRRDLIILSFLILVTETYL